MAYVIAGVVVVLLVAGFVIFMVLRPARAAPPPSAARARPASAPTTTPLGDTTQHAGEQTGRASGDGDPERTGRASDEPDDPEVARTGEAEGEQRIRTGTPPVATATARGHAPVARRLRQLALRV